MHIYIAKAYENLHLVIFRVGPHRNLHLVTDNIKAHLNFPQASLILKKGQGSRRVKIGPVTKINEIWLYCMCMSSVTENDSF